MDADFDLMAQGVFLVALRDHRAGELLQALFDGGSATLDPEGHLVIVDGEQLAAMLGGS